MIRQAHDGRRTVGGRTRRPSALYAMLAGALLVGAPGIRTAAAQEGSEPQRVEVDADRLDYNKETGWIEGHGNVVVRRGDVVLRADTVRVNMNTEDAHAEGNVYLKRADGKELRTDRLDYNFRTGRGRAPRLTAEAAPFRLLDGEAEITGRNEYELRKATVTTCTNEVPHCHYRVYAKRIRLIPKKSLKAWGATFYFGSVPVFYLPYWHREFRKDSGLRLEPGYNSRMGAFLLASYRYPIDSVFGGETHLDYRTERGLGFGQDFFWDRPGLSNGELSLYYTDDEKPIDEDEDPATSDVDAERYRIRLQHSQTYGKRGSLLLEANYLSDTDVLEDFFEDEHRRRSQPENYAVYTHREDSYLVHVAARPRLNEFYEQVSRVPEITVDFNRQQLGDSRFYYEGQTAGSNLERLWPEGSDREDYSTLRFDTAHKVFYPTKVFGFLTCVPRVGARATYYGDSIESQSVVQTNQVTQHLDPADTNSPIVTVTETTVVQQSVPGSSKLRSLFEAGLELSFKAFKTWKGGVVSPLRHVVEPYANYTFVPEPSVVPEELPQFDEVDTLDREHGIRFGIRNKFQSKRRGRAYDLLDVDVNTRYRLEREETEEALGSIFVDAEYRPAEWLAIDLDAELATDDQETSALNARIVVLDRGTWMAGVDYRFREDDATVLGADVTLLPHADWTYNLYGRYEFQEGRLEEEGGYVQRNLDCMSIRLGVNHMPGYTRDDGVEQEAEWRVAFQLWLSAFPHVGLQAGRYRN